MIQFKQQICGDLDAALHREWLETNGLGGFASSTIIGLNTRRYHGLLVAATKPPVGRFVLLAKLEETLFIDGLPFDLSANKHPGVVHPQGFGYLKQFRLDPFPVFTYEVEGIEIEKIVFMIYGANSTVVHYELAQNNHPEAPKNLRLEIRPLIAFRGYHSTTHENSALNPALKVEPGLTAVTPYTGLPTLYLGHNAGELKKTSDWYRNFEYDAERERGLDFREDLFNPFVLQFNLRARPQASVVASTERRDVTRVAEYRQAEITRRQNTALSSPVDDDFARHLATAADQYIVSRGDQKTVIAGYHWFSDWGRDTMIALRGLTLPTGKYEVARSILRTFAKHVDQGMLPNRFPDAGETPEYNTVDATLWFFEAIRALLHYTSDYDFVRQNLYSELTDIIAWHVKGTRYNIHVDEDGLLSSGEPGVQLTWMDAKVGDWVVTPRQGKPVEIQALWYNALRVMEQLAEKFGDKGDRKEYKAMAERARKSFNELFWNEAAGWLYDVVDGEDRDASIRPNQIFAVSLANSLVAKKRAENILRVVERELLTPRGLRTLAPSDPRYSGRYEGDPRSRDGAYHQGTVWPWLMGPYITAYVKTFGEKAGREFGAEWLKNFAGHLSEACVGQGSELFACGA